MSHLEVLLDAAASGDTQASADILPLVYDELRQLAAMRLSSEPAGHTLQPTALVHEAYMRLISTEDRARWRNRGHFFGAVVRAMRRVLLDHARGRNRIKRGKGQKRVELNEAHKVVHLDPAREMAMDEALTRLGAEDPSAAAVAAFHVFGGMSIEEIAESLGVARSTAYEHWAYARAWLGAALRDNDGTIGAA